MTAPVTTEGDRLYSDWQQPVNRWAQAENSIHNDAVARKVGMRGGTIPGTVHLNHFLPIILERWGRRWFERGTISMFYTYATTDREDVRAVVKDPGDAADVRVDAWVETPQGRVVAKGSLSVGDPGGIDYVRGLELVDAPRGDLRILADLHTGDACQSSDDVSIDSGGGEGELDGMLIYPATMYGMLSAGLPRHRIKRAVGFFGATEISLRNGPIRIDHTYRRSGNVVCVGASSKTEFAWVDSRLEDPETDVVVAEMRHMTRWMKASSELWSPAG